MCQPRTEQCKGDRFETYTLYLDVREQTAESGGGEEGWEETCVLRPAGKGEEGVLAVGPLVGPTEQSLSRGGWVDLWGGLQDSLDEGEPLCVEDVDHEGLLGAAQGHCFLGEVDESVLVAEYKNIKPVVTVCPRKQWRLTNKDLYH